MTTIKTLRDNFSKIIFEKSNKVITILTSLCKCVMVNQ